MSLIPDHFPYTYDKDIQSEFQQLESRLRHAMGNVHHVPEAGKKFHIGGASSSKARTRGWNDTNPDQPARRERWLKMLDSGARGFKTNDEWIDELDAKRLGEVGDPTPERIAMQMAEAGRDCDAAIIDGLKGDAHTGSTGSTAVSFPTGNVIDVDFGAANSGCTYTKLVRGKTLLGAANVTGQRVETNSKIAYVCTHFEIEDLLHEDKFISSDYAGTRERAEAGEIFDHAGITFIPVSPGLLPLETYSGGKKRDTYMFAKSAVAFGIGCDRTTRVTQEGTKNSAILLHLVYGFTCGRIHDKGVRKIQSARTTAQAAMEETMEGDV